MYGYRRSNKDVSESLLVGDHANRCYSMKYRTIAYATILLILFGFAREATAADIAGYSGVNLNVRSGPSVRFPPIGMLGAGSALTIHGCLARYTWCDVSAPGLRGWASGAHIKFIYEARHVYVPGYAAQVEVPIVTFNLPSYWDDYYRDYDFYGELDRWSQYRWEDDGAPPGWRDNWDDQYDAWDDRYDHHED